MDTAFKDADIIYAKSWGRYGPHTAIRKKAQRSSRNIQSWITDERKMKLAKPDAIYMHPLPADRNIEVTDGVMDGPNRWCMMRPKTACMPRKPSWRSRWVNGGIII